MVHGIMKVSQDFIQQALFLAVIVIVMFAVVAKTDNYDFFKTYYAKDIGSTVSAIYAAPGSVIMEYEKLNNNMGFAYKFTKSALLMGNSKKNDQGKLIIEEKDLDTRKVYGYSSELQVKETQLINPQALFLLKEGKEIIIDESEPAFSNCKEAKQSLILKNTKITIKDDDNLFSESEFQNPLEKFNYELQFEFKQVENNNNNKNNENKNENNNNDVNNNNNNNNFNNNLIQIKVLEGNSLKQTNNIVCLLDNFLEDSTIVREEQTTEIKSEDSEIKTETNNVQTQEKKTVIEIDIPKDKPGLNLDLALKKTYLILFE